MDGWMAKSQGSGNIKLELTPNQVKLASRYAWLEYLFYSQIQIRELHRQLKKTKTLGKNLASVITSLQLQSKNSKDKIVKGSNDLFLIELQRAHSIIKSGFTHLEKKLDHTVDGQRRKWSADEIPKSAVGKKLGKRVLSEALNETLYELSLLCEGPVGVYELFERSGGTFPPGLPKSTSRDVIRQRINRHKLTKKIKS